MGPIVGGVPRLPDAALGASLTWRRWGALRPADFRAWLAAQAADGAGNATRARHLAAVRTFFRLLARRQGVENPAVEAGRHAAGEAAGAEARWLRHRRAR